MHSDTNTQRRHTRAHRHTKVQTHTDSHIHTHYKPLSTLNPDSRAPQAWSLPASLTAGHHWVPQGPDLGPRFPPLLVTGNACSLHGQAGRGRVPRAGQRLGSNRKQVRGSLPKVRPPPFQRSSGARCALVTWSPGAGGLALSAGNVEPLCTCGSTYRKSRSSPAPGSRLVSQLCCVSFRRCRFISLHAFLKLWGSLLCLKLVAQKSRKYLGRENSPLPPTAGSQRRGWGSVSFQACREQVPWMGLKSWRIPASVSQQRRPHE